ncbi:DNA processing protein [Mumia flava]|uniref:DNA processing protein n=1 Tax=Mumia flava TaxID=1348852 RepID=A0A0B2BL33_9ACTN|nr:DNA-processing protein DprA [Mumia flava]PJJ56315.1 DNA processing protein [Mumia flava]
MSGADRSARRDRMALSLVVEAGDPRLAAALVDREPGAVLEAVRAGDPGIPEPWRARARSLEARVASTLARARDARLRWVCPGDADWPAPLDDLDHVGVHAGVAGRPLGLWMRGRRDLAADGGVAVVGSRDATAYGCDVAADLAADLAESGRCVLSGAALGIDGAAHRGALAVGGPTLAVLACGADVDYPRAHAGLLTRLSEVGAVVSEQPPGSAPTRARFLTRNRLIAALGAGTVVVEAAVRSGALNTLGWAAELGRLVHAVPGPVTNRSSSGVHQAIRDGRAVLAASAADVLEDHGGLLADGLARTPGSRAASTWWDALAPRARQVLEEVPAAGGISGPRLADEIGRRPDDVEATLRSLAAAGLVARTERGWRLVRRADLEPADGRPTLRE